jgi:thiopeptide-type bacteriocin biosynthesis protein
MRGEQRWLQVNVDLGGPRVKGLEGARAVFRELRPLLRTWRCRGHLGCFFFVRKPPGVRLRFLASDPSRQILPRLRGRLSRLERLGFIRRFFPSVYEPEVRLFGGAEAMNLIHAYFDVDTDAWLELDRLGTPGCRVLSGEVLSLAVMNDLFAAVLADSGEVWDVWCNVGELRPALKEDPPAMTILMIRDVLPLVTPAERRVLRRYTRANHTLARGLVRLWNRGVLSCGVRGILPFIATFHFNRHGLDLSQQSRLVGGMVAAWSPRGRMRCAERRTIRLSLKPTK